ncbi:uncharacterized protein [Parasteatoda tepidariorum]|uniref:uncharacterized protein n=1 Tax=Parasteatoda tepidariorum TaxID=114398 RepID=UPI001C721DFB|nr:uncharacterized protein LOC122270756 [Parasteatoda tepidariorum]
MKGKDNFNTILFFALLVLLTLISFVTSFPLNNKAAGWMSTTNEDTRSYHHLSGSSKFSKSAFSQPPRVYHGLSGNSSNKTLAAILLLTVFGVGATAFFMIVCSKITKKEQYDSVKGTIY